MFVYVLMYQISSFALYFLHENLLNFFIPSNLPIDFLVERQLARCVIQLQMVSTDEEGQNDLLQYADRCAKEPNAFYCRSGAAECQNFPHCEQIRPSLPLIKFSSFFWNDSCLNFADDAANVFLHFADAMSLQNS